MNKYTPQDHVLLTVQRFLGCEDWEPSSDLIERCKKEGLTGRFQISQKLKEWGERTSLGHETKILNILTGGSPTELTEKDKAHLQKSFQEWWETEPKKYSFTEFVRKWADQKQRTGGLTPLDKCEACKAYKKEGQSIECGLERGHPICGFDKLRSYRKQFKEMSGWRATLRPYDKTTILRCNKCGYPLGSEHTQYVPGVSRDLILQQVVQQMEAHSLECDPKIVVYSLI